MSVTKSLAEIKTALGDREARRVKRRRWAQTLVGFFNTSERARRLKALQRAADMEKLPSRWQIALGTVEMMVLYVLPGGMYLYSSTGKSFWWQQVLRLLDEPSAVFDPMGLGAPKETIISHLLQVVHHQVGYDVELLHMFPGGHEELHRQVRLLVAGTHPRQAAIEGIVEKPYYHRALLKCLDEYEEVKPTGDPLEILPPPPGSEMLYEGHHDEHLSTPTRFLHYCHSLPSSPGALLKRASRWALRTAIRRSQTRVLSLLGS